MLLNVECKTCHREFDADVGEITFIEENNVPAPIFSKKPCCPKCGERTKQQIYLTELGQSQLTDVWMNPEES